MSIHESSILHPSAEIDNDVQIGPFCVVGESVKIESGSKLFSHIVLKGPTTIGKNNIFYQFCTIGEDTPDKKFKGEERKGDYVKGFLEFSTKNNENIMVKMGISTVSSKNA